MSKSHPSIKFERLPTVKGPLHRMNKMRYKVVRNVARDTAKGFLDRNLDLVLGEALYNERLRINRISRFDPSFLFNIRRHWGDRSLWKGVKKGLLKSSAEADRKNLLDKVSLHYSREIAGHFRPSVYRFATGVVPWIFNWLLNAASVKKIVPGKTVESLEGALSIHGEIPHVQKLAEKGTILMVPTHQSNIDSILIGYVIYLMRLPPFSYGAGLNLFTNPVLNFFMSNLGSYTVDRAKWNGLYKATLKSYSSRILREGVHSIFFPGGGRSRSGALESHLKLGLLGTGLEAQRENLRRGREKPNIYVVPMVMSYHFVLEASALIESYLAQKGRDRFIWSNAEEVPKVIKALNFFWKLFSAKNEIVVRIGKPLDIFGNPVDEEGRSIGPNGTTIDAKKWLTTCGELRAEPQRDQEYVRLLGASLVDRYYKENTVLSSALVAFAYFMSLRKRYPDLDLYRFLRLSRAQRAIPYSDFLQEAEMIHGKIMELYQKGELQISDDIKKNDLKTCVETGIKQLGTFHNSEVLKVSEGAIWTGNMNLLYYYRNRLSGYGISLLGELGRAKRLRGEEDEQGFLA